MSRDYKHTGSTVGASFLQDVAEVFIQRAHEIDESGELEQRFEYLWEVSSDGDRSLWDRLIAADPAAGAVLEGLYDDVASKAAAGYSLMLSNPPTESDYAQHNPRLDKLAQEGQKIVLAAHSQGNLFVNQAYSHVLPLAKLGSVGVVHIAPASPTLSSSRYILSAFDFVVFGIFQDINL